ncbi:MAG: hypothetical protein M3357_17340, partial [Actinomycetota bacterium]|nr:hypothetical protein [Actinomycetota bacterium]
ARRRTPLPLVLAVAALCFLAAWFVSGLGGDGDQPGPAEAQPPADRTATTAVPASGIPALDDALSDLEKILR